MEKWRADIASIDRMDSVGTLSFEHWKTAHDKESDNWKSAHAMEHHRVDERLKELRNRCGSWRNAKWLTDRYHF